MQCYIVSISVGRNLFGSTYFWLLQFATDYLLDSLNLQLVNPVANFVNIYIFGLYVEMCNVSTTKNLFSGGYHMNFTSIPGWPGWSCAITTPNAAMMKIVRILPIINFFMLPFLIRLESSLRKLYVRLAVWCRTFLPQSLVYIHTIVCATSKLWEGNWT